MRLPGVGMRTVKTAVAVMLSYLVFVPFGLLYREELGGVLGQIGPMYACIACVVCMQSSLGQTMQQGISRFIGVAVGGVLGVLALSLGEAARQPLVKTAILGLICVAGIWVCLLIKRPTACGMACIVPCVILINDMVGVERYYYAAARIIETVVGVAIAFGVNAVLPDHRPEEERGDPEEQNRGTSGAPGPKVVRGLRLSTKPTASLKNASIFSKRCRPLHRTAQHFLLRRTFAA